MREIAREFALSRKTGFAHDRRLTIGASDIGKCARRTKYSKLGTEYDDGYVDANGFATRGDVMEDAWTAPLLTHWVEKNGGKMLYAGQGNQVSLVSNKVLISATPDGLAIGVQRGILEPYGVSDVGKSKALVIEMKSISPRYGKHKLPKIEHPMQTLVQLGMIRASTPYKPDWGCVVYVEADDFWNINVFPVQWSEKGFKQLVKRADHIMKVDDPNKLPPEGKMKGGSECSECPFARRCLGYRPYVADDDPKALPKAAVAKIEKLAKKYHELEIAEDEAKRRKLAAEADLYLGLADVKRNFVQGTTFKTFARKTPAQNRTDSKKLIALLKEKGATAAEIEACRSPTKEGSSLTVELV